MAAYTQAAQILGITSAACLAGMIASISLIGIPVIALAPKEVAVKQWKRTYGIGKASAPPLALASAACFGYLAYASRDVVSKASILGLKSPMVLFAVAALAIPSVVPFTGLVMEPRVNLALMGLAGEAEKAEKGSGITASDVEVQRLLKEWEGLNYIRACAVGTGAVLGAIATIAM